MVCLNRLSLIPSRPSFWKNTKQRWKTASARIAWDRWQLNIMFISCVFIFYFYLSYCRFICDFCPVCPVHLLSFSLGLINGGFMVIYYPLRLVRRCLYDDVGWDKSMASNNRMFPCIHSKSVSNEKICQALVNAVSNSQVILVLLLFHCNFHPCSTLYRFSSVSCSSHRGNTVMFPALFRPHASFCEGSDLFDCRAPEANPACAHTPCSL